MNLHSKIKKSRFILSCIFLSGYTAYTVYAVYYYRNFGNQLSIVLLTLISVAFVLSAIITFVSYRINLKDAPRPKVHRFLKMAKYLVQLISSAISLSLVISAVQNMNLFSLIIAGLSIPFLLWGLLVNVLAEYLERRFASLFRTKEFVRETPVDSEGNTIDLTNIIANVDGGASMRRMIAQKEKPPRH